MDLFTVVPRQNVVHRQNERLGEKLDSSFSDKLLAIDRVAPTFPRLDGQRFPFPRGPRPRKPGSPSAIAGSARATTSSSIDCPAQAVLGCVENVLVWVEGPLVLVTPRTVVKPTRTAFGSPWQNGVAESGANWTT